jgi:hypothetical protein
MGLAMLNYFKSEDGSSVAEYALVLTILGAGLALGVINFKSAAKTAVESAATGVSPTAAVGGSGSGGSTNSTNSTGDTGGDTGCKNKNKCGN